MISNRGESEHSSISSESTRENGSRKRKFASLRELLSESPSEHSEHTDQSNLSDRIDGRNPTSMRGDGLNNLTPISRVLEDSSFWSPRDMHQSRQDRQHRRLERMDDNITPVNMQRNARRNSVESSPLSEDLEVFGNLDDDLLQRQHLRPGHEYTPDPPTARRLFGNQPRSLKRRRLNIDTHTDGAQGNSLSIMREIRRLQHTTHKLIPQLAFARLVKDISDQTSEDLGFDFRFKWTAESLEALHEAAEAHVVKVLERSNWCATHAKRITLTRNDIYLSRRLSEKDVCPTWTQALKPAHELD